METMLACNTTLAVLLCGGLAVACVVHRLQAAAGAGDGKFLNMK